MPLAKSRTALILVCTTLCACASSGIGTDVRYQLALPPNISFGQLPGTPADVYRGLDVELHVSQVLSDCSLGFLGSIPIPSWENEAFALRPGTIHYLVVALEGGKLKGGLSALNIAAMIDPRRGFSYRLFLGYEDDAYRLQLFERAPEGEERPIPYEPYPCEPNQ